MLIKILQITYLFFRHSKQQKCKEYISIFNKNTIYIKYINIIQHI